MHKPVPPKSISVMQMLKLGKVVESPEVVYLYQFDLSTMRWSTIPKPVRFNISKDLLGEGAFRRAYKARTNNKELSAFTWVVKEYTRNALEVISETEESGANALPCPELCQSVKTRNRESQPQVILVYGNDRP